ncbi:MAG: hypothetical protein HRJ53_28120 [Acidobacteria bacterium Pan2503]|uniref:Uncharacterized protein n=1 Tax=Candidatus Acidiferrum panamense TaxID=2741543 RepID=A0A7V8NWR6_9BACT|nr:hypothetical protein [Candidatus Acidoferrum panamensis]
MKAKVTGCRGITPGELAWLRGGEGRYRPPAVAKLRDAHHTMARLFACGFGTGQVAAMVGYSFNRVSMIHTDPAFAQLVAEYRKSPGLEEATWGPIEALAMNYTQIAIKGSRHVLDHFEQAEEAGELVPFRQALSAVADAADRIGLGKRATVTHNIDFAARLDAAIKRSERAKVIEGEAA